jgi:lipopolysaccharide export system protein LptC
LSGFSSAPAQDAVPALVHRGHAYEAARRHSTRVRRLKIAIPLGAAAVAGLVALATFANPLGNIGGLTLGPVSLAGTKIAMQNPRLTGFRKDSRPYEVTAITAFQDVRKPGVIELKDMRAKLTLDGSGSIANLVSHAGLFDSAKELLELSDDIRITTTRGDEVLLRSASVDFKGGTVVSKDPVKISTANGMVEAEGLQVSDSGSTISFTGRVRTQFTRPVADPATTSSTPPAGSAPRVSQAEPVKR